MYRPVLLGRLDVTDWHGEAERMLTAELYARVRRAVMLEYSVPLGNRRRERPVSKKLGPRGSTKSFRTTGALPRSSGIRRGGTSNGCAMKRLFWRLHDRARVCGAGRCRVRARCLFR
jgi:hypothetical protein